MTELKVLGFVTVIVIVDETVPVNETLQSKGKLFDFLIYFVVAGNIVEELKLVGTDGSGGRSKCSNNEIFHPCVILSILLINFKN